MLFHHAPSHQSSPILDAALYCAARFESAAAAYGFAGSKCFSRMLVEPHCTNDLQQLRVDAPDPPPSDQSPPPPPDPQFTSRSPIRNELWQWFLENGASTAPADVPFVDDHNESSDVAHDARSAEERIAEAEYDQTLIQEYDRLSAPYEGVSDTEPHLSVGDLVELPLPQAEGRFAVYLGIKHEWNMFYTIGGLLYAQLKRAAFYAASKHVSVEELRPILDSIPEEVYSDDSELRRKARVMVPIEIGGAVVKKMQAFKRGAESCYRHYAQELDSIYEFCAHPTETRWQSIDDLVRIVVAEYDKRHAGMPPSKFLADDDHMRSAVTTAALRTKFGFGVDTRAIFQTKGFTVESKANTVAVRDTRAWIRAYQELRTKESKGLKSSHFIESLAQPIISFTHTARRLVALSRSIRDTSECGMFVSAKSPEGIAAAGITANGKPGDNAFYAHTFNEEENKIITFLAQSAELRNFARHGSIEGLVPILIRAIGMYPEEEEVRNETVHKFLVEIGVLQTYDTALPWNRLMNRSSKEPRRGGDRTEADSEERPKPHLIKDSMKSLRKDWGDLRGYILDAVSSHDADDAISVEPIEDEPGKMWLHVHISHVSAFIPPSSPVALEAERRMASFYFPEVTLHMFPRWVIEEFQVASGHAVLTHSMKIDTINHTVSDYQIQPGILRNAVRLAPDDVDEGIFNFRRASPSFEMMLGDVDKTEEKTRLMPTLDERTVRDFRHFLTIGNSLLKSSAAQFFNERGKFRKMRAWTGSDERVSAFTADKHDRVSRYELAQPKIRFTVTDEDIGQRSAETRTPSDFILSLIMTETCAQAARWAAHRNLPVPFSGTTSPIEITDEHRLALREKFTSLAAQGHNAVVSNRLFLHARHFWGVRRVASHPIEQRFINLKAYTKVTSPLRRFYDLITCWQIDATLRQEAKMGASLTASEDQSFLPLRREQVNVMIEDHERNLLDTRRFEAAHVKQWTHTAVMRAVKLKEAQLPTRLIGTVGAGMMKKEHHVVTLSIDDLDMLTQALDLVGKDGQMLNPGDTWEIELVTVYPSRRMLICVPIRRIAEMRPEHAALFE